MVAPHAPAQVTWNNSAGGNWSLGSNWLGGTAPTLDNRLGGTLVINFTPDNLNVPDLCNQYRYPVSAKILSYGN